MREELEQQIERSLEAAGSALATPGSLMDELRRQGAPASKRSVERALEQGGFLPKSLKVSELRSESGEPLNTLVAAELQARARARRLPSLVIQAHHRPGHTFVVSNDGRAGRRWMRFAGAQVGPAEVLRFLDEVARSLGRDLVVWPAGEMTGIFRQIVQEQGSHDVPLDSGHSFQCALTAYGAGPVSRPAPASAATASTTATSATATSATNPPNGVSHLDQLEAESIHIIREVMAEAGNPVMLYSIGKDSSVMLRLAQKAFYPGVPPFPLLHVDTRWKFQAMYEFRDRIAGETGMDLIVHVNPEGAEKNINPFDHGSALHTDVMKTQGLVQALDKYGFDAAFGGARRDEEKSRAKERVFSFRNSAHRWDPKNQRPELWNLYNGKKAPGESIRVFPLSNWTELDIWQYIMREDIPIVPLYFAAERPVIERDGMLMLVDDDRLKLFPGEKIQTRRVRFRTLGCYPLTGAIESDADTLPKILLELLEARTSERQGRAIDTDSAGSMEKKKQEGYF